MLEVLKGFSESILSLGGLYFIGVLNEIFGKRISFNPLIANDFLMKMPATNYDVEQLVDNIEGDEKVYTMNWVIGCIGKRLGQKS